MEFDQTARPLMVWWDSPGGCTACPAPPAPPRGAPPRSAWRGRASRACNRGVVVSQAGRQAPSKCSQKRLRFLLGKYNTTSTMYPVKAKLRHGLALETLIMPVLFEMAMESLNI